MLKRYAAALAALILLASIPAQADYVIRDGQSTPAQQTFGSFSLSGVQFPKHVMVDPTTGAAIGVSGAPLFAQIPDGADVTQGAKADAAYAGSGTASIVGLLKGIYGGLYAPLPAGTNLIGKADSVIQATSTARGGTITTASTAQQFMAANAARRGFTLQNQSSGDLYVNCVGAATLDYNSLKIPAGALYESSPQHVGTGACSIIGATAAQAYYAREF